MKKMMWTIRIAVLAVAVSMPLWAGVVYLREAYVVDRCLDQGGSFNYETMSPDFEQSHPYVPFGSRHPYLLKTATIWFAAGVVFFGATMLLTRRKRGQDQTLGRTS